MQNGNALCARFAGHLRGAVQRLVPEANWHQGSSIRKKVVRQKGFEPLTHGLEGRCSIQLSYWRTKRISYLVKRIPSEWFPQLTHEIRLPRYEIRFLNRGERI